jgi:hypothetical protein
MLHNLIRLLGIKSFSRLLYYFKTYIHQFYIIPSCGRGVKHMVSLYLAMRGVSFASTFHLLSLTARERGSEPTIKAFRNTDKAKALRCVSYTNTS